MTIGKKLMLGFAAMLLAALGLAGAYLYSVRNLGEELRIATSSTSEKILLLSEVGNDLLRLRLAQRSVILFSIGKEPEKVRAAREQFEADSTAIIPLVNKIKPLLVTDRGRQDAATLESELPHAKTYFGQVAEAAEGKDFKRAFQINDEHSVKIFDSLDAASHDLLDIQKMLLQQGIDRGARDAAQARWTAFILVLAALAIGPFVLMTVIRTTRSLRDVAEHLHDGAEQITSAAAQVATSSQTLAQGASEQAASLEETSASSEEITSMTRKNAENSQSAASVMAEVDQRVNEGNRTLEQMVQSMQEITGSSDKISKIIKVIDEIAFQTNILALNAAVEAARADEAGMGFAVVADEVRSLAQRSAQAAKDTASLIEESITKSNEGSQRLEHVTEVIHAITESAAKVKTLVDEVNLGSQEQARGIAEISKSIAEMDRVTQGNAASAEQSASASEQMSAQAQSLQNIARELRTLVGGESDRSPAPRSSARQRRSSPATPASPKSRDLAALQSAVTPHKSFAAPPVAVDNQAFPLEDDFVNM
ncbi:MAG TPA: methyl-accepting chemotaxis protein [Bryobacteraceae bacterium]|nr:methyl-accepting chemotaxis protein [Bryobacteraceae bacterium]